MPALAIDGLVGQAVTGSKFSTMKERSVYGDGGGDVEVTVVGGPPECGSQIGHLDGEPGVGVALSGAVPHGEHIGLAPGEVAGVCGAGDIGMCVGDELLLGELADRLQHRKPGPPRGPVGDQE